MAGAGTIDVEKVFLAVEAPESNAAARRSELLTLAAVVATKVALSSAISGLQGGGPTNLDGLATVPLSVPNIAIIVVGETAQIWRLVAGTDAEDVAHGVLRPDDYNGVSNARVWKQAL